MKRTNKPSSSGDSQAGPAKPADAADLHRQAVARLRAGLPPQALSCSPEDTQRLVNELQVHQIELEMQNEELRHSRAEVEAGLERYSDLYDFAPVGYLSLNRDGTIRQANLTGAELLGMERARLIGRRLAMFIAPGDRAAFSIFLQKVFAGQAREACEVAIGKEDDPRRHARIEALAGEDGQMCRAVIMDITERKLANQRLQESQHHFVALAERNHRLARELQHRVRNSIQGLIGLVSVLRTRMTDVQDFADAMESRLMALGHVQHMLSETNWGQVDLRELVTSTLAAMQSLAPRAAALVVDGPPVLIGPAQVTPLVLIFAEWFTNSCKYGAHTSPNGQVTITWRMADPGAPAPQIHLSWTETGGPAIAATVTPSLGTELVDGFAARELHGRVCLGYPPQGVRHSLFFPIIPQPH